MTDPAPATGIPVIKPFPLTPSAFWDNPTRRVVWTDVSPRSPLGRAARAHKLLCATLPNEHLKFATSQEELALLLIWTWEHQ